MRDAAITRDASTGSWTIAAGGASMSLTIDPSMDYRVAAIVSPAGTNWIRASGPDTIVTVNGETHEFGVRAAGFVYAFATARINGNHLELDAAFTLMPQNLRVVRHVSVVPGSPTFELWTSFRAMDQPLTLSNLNSFHAAMSDGTLHWVTGHQAASDDPTLDSSFARRQRTLLVGETMQLGSGERSSEEQVPWLTIDGSGDEFYGGLMWSGGWSLKAARTNSGLSIDWGLAVMDTTVGNTPVEGPHAIIGIARGALPDASAALRTYIIEGIRGGRPLTPLVTYNTWFAYGTSVDETSMRREMEHAAAMGVELFVLDAGWYAGADTNNVQNFLPGLGIWEADPGRFPNGLNALTDYAHSLGMKFGVWIEPERMDRSLVGRNGLDESALAMAAGSYQSNDAAMICLAGEAGRRWVMDRLTALVETVRPDYLKWDNNLWFNCDRKGHGHGPTDGGFAHVNALYEILGALRQKYPQLLIENCSGGGNRLDFGMLRYSDVAWMDDHTAPSVRVRHNIDGLSLVFPPAYLLSFVTNLGWEPVHNSPDLLMYMRSRMEAVLGLCFRSAWLSDDDRDAIASQIALYKSLRPTLASAAATLLTDQANEGGGPAWEALQETATDGSVLLYVFGDEETVVFPANLRTDVVYRVLSADNGLVGDATGAALMSDGIRVFRMPATAAHLFSLTPHS